MTLDLTELEQLDLEIRDSHATTFETEESRLYRRMRHDSAVGKILAALPALLGERSDLMAIQPCYLINDDHEMVHYGVALVDTVTGFPLPLSRNVLTTLEEAEAFLNWVRNFTGYDARKCDAAELELLGIEWRTRHEGIGKEAVLP